MIKNTKKRLTEQGFTIVELLIVIVVIGILAAITIVAYNGVQNRAKTSSAQSTAVSVDKKVELYGADDTTASSYPATLSLLTAAGAQSQVYGVPATSVTPGTPVNGTAPANANTIGFYKCGTGATTAAPTTAAGVTTQTGVRVDYYDYTSATVKSIAAGATTGLVGTYNIGCAISNS